MSKNKIKVEIYEGDPFTGCCGPGVGSMAAIERTRKMLIERNEIVKRLREEFKEEIEVERDIISVRKLMGSYPEHVRRLILESTALPFVLINGQVALVGAFPSLEWFRSLISKHLTQSTIDKEVVL